MKHRMLALSCVVLLGGCSKAPSDAEAKAALETAVGKCGRFVVDSFDKTNGVAQGENRYQVAVNYTIRVVPPANAAVAQADWVAKVKDVNQRLKQEEQDFAEAGNMLRDANAKVNGGDHEEASLNDRDARREKYDKTERQVGLLKAEQFKVTSSVWHSFEADCANTDKAILANIAAASEQFEAQNPGKNAYLAGFVTKFSGTLNLVKTENGWQSGL